MPVRLLPSPVKRVVKDAARAVNRVDSLTIHVVSVDTLTELLGLPGMEVKKYSIESQGEEKYLHLFCEHQHNVAICPRCGEAMEGGYDQKNRCVRHLDIWGMRTLVHFSQRRFDCEVCGKPFSENLEWTEPNRRQTRAYETYIYQRTHKTCRKHVALEEGLSESTVLDIFKKQAQKSIRQPHQGVRVLGVDEISLRKGHKQYALVLSDLERRCVIAVLTNREKKTFEKWLGDLSEDQRRMIKVVSMDMWNPYRQAVRKMLGAKVVIVADRFHVVKQLNHQLDLLRRSLQKKADDELALILKGSRWVLLKRRSELNAEEEAKLRIILDASEELRAIYLLREEFRAICDKIKDKAQAERFLRAWIWKAVATGSRYLIRFVNTLRNWWGEFLNYFVDRVTQGFVEGTNRAIRGIINRAFGFRDFDNFRLQVLTECGGP